MLILVVGRKALHVIGWLAESLLPTVIRHAVSDDAQDTACAEQAILKITGISSSCFNKHSHNERSSIDGLRSGWT